MIVPFLRASCGCIVIPLDRPSKDRVGVVDVICVKPCDGDAEWGFGVRPMEPHKVTLKDGHDYKNQPLPRRLTEQESDQVIEAIGLLVRLGHQARELSHALRWIGEFGNKLPDFSAAGEVKE